MLFILAMQQNQNSNWENDNISENAQLKSHLLKETIQAQSKFLQMHLKRKVREMQQQLFGETNENFMGDEQENDDFLLTNDNSRNPLHNFFGNMEVNQRTRSPDVIRRRHKKKKIGKDEINSIQEKKLKKHFKGKLPDKNCSICLNDFCVGDHISYLPCCHIYHSKCIKKWLKISSTCPLCKVEVKV